jgi:hypothetical protein
MLYFWLLVLLSLLSFDMSDCTFAAMDEINNNNDNNKWDLRTYNSLMFHYSIYSKCYEFRFLLWLIISNAKVRNVCSYKSIPSYIFIVWCLVIHKDDTLFHLFESLWLSLKSTTFHPSICIYFNVIEPNHYCHTIFFITGYVSVLNILNINI